MFDDAACLKQDLMAIMQNEFGNRFFVEEPINFYGTQFTLSAIEDGISRIIKATLGSSHYYLDYLYSLGEVCGQGVCNMITPLEKGFFSEVEGVFCIYDKVDTLSLEKLLFIKEKLSLLEAAEIALKASRAIASLHEIDMNHMFICPKNILIKMKTGDIFVKDPVLLPSLFPKVFGMTQSSPYDYFPVSAIDSAIDKTRALEIDIYGLTMLLHNACDPQPYDHERELLQTIINRGLLNPGYEMYQSVSELCADINELCERLKAIRDSDCFSDELRYHGVLNARLFKGAANWASKLARH